MGFCVTEYKVFTSDFITEKKMIDNQTPSYHLEITELKATNEQIRKTNKQKLIDTDNSMVVTRGQGAGVVKVKGVKYTETEDLTLGGGHTMQHTDDVS